MIIETKLNVGDVIWVPRVYTNLKVDSVVVDGKTYWSDQENAVVLYEPSVKRKVVTNIDIEIGSNGTKIRYWTTGDSGTYICIDDKSVYFLSEKEALDSAVMKAKNREAYYG